MATIQTLYADAVLQVNPFSSRLNILEMIIALGMMIFGVHIHVIGGFQNLIPGLFFGAGRFRAY